jgi:RHS repeat-associated protein
MQAKKAKNALEQPISPKTTKTYYVLAGSLTVAKRIYTSTPDPYTPGYYYNDDKTQWLYRNHLNQVIATEYALGYDNLTLLQQAWHSLQAFASGGNDQFQGHKDDSESGLRYNLARYYDPATSRWAAADNVTTRVYDPQSLNKYAYVRNDPMNLVDPDGLDVEYFEEWNDDNTPNTTVIVTASLSQEDLDNNFANLLYGSSYPFSHDPTLATDQAGATSWNAGMGAPPVPNMPQPPATITCTGRARVLQGNSSLVGRRGSFGVVGLNTAAIIPRQFMFATDVLGRAAMMPYVNQISGTINGTLNGLPFSESFSSVTDVIGGRSPIPGVPVRDALMFLNQMLFIIEVPGGRDLGTASIVITIPAGLQCPIGTRP